jgi:arylsulfatase A-like enzyme
LHAITWVRKPIRGDGDPPPIGSGKLSSLDFVRQLVAHGADLNARHGKHRVGSERLNRTGATPLLLAAETGDVPLMRLLVELGADPLLPNIDDCTPLLAASGVGVLSDGDESAGTEEEAIEAIAFLLERNADINAVDKHGKSAMHGAAYKSWPKLVQYLADHGADIGVWNRKNARGWTPLMIAQGHRPGNFRPSPKTIAALQRVMQASATAGADRPNILWITSEDNGQYLGCYGDPVARTPRLDQFAKSGTRFLNCFSNAAVCAPARQTLITGMYATSLGGQHMRSDAVFPSRVRYFPQYLRDAGYYTSNNSKTDYNGGPSDRRQAMDAAWDASSNTAHWRNRPAARPFFSVFNVGDSHESRLFPKGWDKRELKTNPADVRLPAYLPDLSETRRDMARYYDCIEAMDGKVGRVLDQLEEDGLTDSTIVFYFSDHGGALPRGKSFTYDSGTHVPLIVSIPERWKRWRPTNPGDATDRLVSFVDFAATVLSLAGLDPPDYMQGYAFLGDLAGEPRSFVHTFRGRRGERYDIVRGVRSQQFLYLRNYTPHLPVMQYNGYSFGIPSYMAWMKAWRQGQCTPEQARWFETKAAEELYAVAEDPDNVHNLAGQRDYDAVLAELRAENDRHIAAIRDSVFYAEGLQGREFEAYQSDDSYPLDVLTRLANKVSAADPANMADFRQAMSHPNRCVRYWGVMGCVVLGKRAEPARPDLIQRLADSEPLIQIQAARALVGIGEVDAAVPTIRHYLEEGDQIIQLRAALVVDECELLKVVPDLESPLKKVRGQYGKRVVDRALNPDQ